MATRSFLFIYASLAYYLSSLFLLAYAASTNARNSLADAAGDSAP